MSLDDIRETVRRARGRAKVEISGGVTLERLPELAATGRRLRVGRRADALGARRRHQLRDRADLSVGAAAAGPRLRRSSERAAALGPLGGARALLSRPSDRPTTWPRRWPPSRRRDGTVVIADAQTAGRGRRGRTWFSPPGSGLYVSVVLAPARAASEPDRATMLLTLAAGVALAEGVERATGLSPDIKWPNDLLVGGRKLAGILAEGCRATAPSSCSATASTSVRWRIRRSSRDRATSLETELGRSIDRAARGRRDARRARGAVRRSASAAGSMLFSTPGGAGRRRSRGARVVWDTPAGPQSGITDGIDDPGALLVRVGGPCRTDRRGRSALGSDGLPCS